jgi:hypothetical protein
MAKLKYTFKTDILFKMLFVRHPELLRQLVAALLGIRFEGIERLEVANPEMPPEIIGGKFCRLDISMDVDGRLVNLEIQVRDEGDYPERALFHWSRAPQGRRVPEPSANGSFEHRKLRPVRVCGVLFRVSSAGSIAARNANRPNVVAFFRANKVAWGT